MKSKILILNSPITGSASYLLDSVYESQESSSSISDILLHKSIEDDLPKKRGRKKKDRIYFSEETEDYIVLYNKSKSDAEKNKIYENHIKYSFEKMAEIIINRFKFTYIPEELEYIKHDVVSYMMSVIHKYDKSKGKAFSYFSIVAKNYLIIWNNTNFSILKVTNSISAIDSAMENYHEYNEFDVIDESIVDDEHKHDLNQFIDELIKYWNVNIPLFFKKKRDIEIANAVIEVLKHKHSIEVIRKKVIYHIIREITGHKPIYIKKVLTTMSEHYFNLKRRFFSDGYLSDNDFFI